MPRQNITKVGRRPEQADLLILRVLARERISPSFTRVTLGGGDAGRFAPMGFDQWARLFIPVDDGSALARVPRRLTLGSYLRYLTLAKTQRPLLRSYTVGGHRPDGPQGPELDVDFVLHAGPDGSLGPAAAWAEGCAIGDRIALLDEGIGFAPPADVARVELVGDETALPAIAGILASLPPETTGRARIEVPVDEDRRELARPAGVEVEYVVRGGADVTPGTLVRDRVLEETVAAPLFGWVAGEASLATAVRRHWVAAGLAKDRVAFCGYWRLGAGH